MGFPICWRVATSHNRTVPSALPLARVLPSGLNATEKTESVCACEGRDTAEADHVPQPHRAIAAAAGQGLAVRAERHRQVAGVEPVKLPICWRVATSHNRTRASLLPLARVLPSGLNATEKTEPPVDQL